MGRRKTKKIKQSKSSLALKNRNKIDREFHCHNCQHDRSVSIKMDMRSAIGFLKCRICGVDYSSRITSLDEPIDVYTAWIDACREHDKHNPPKEHTKSAKMETKSSPQHTYEKPLAEDEPAALSNDDAYENTFDVSTFEVDSFKKDDEISNELVDISNYNEIGDSTSKPEYEFTFVDDTTKPEYGVVYDELNVTKTNFSDRIIGSYELDNSFEISRNPDTHVHNLFQDED